MFPDIAADARAFSNETVFPKWSQLKIDFRAVPETFVQVTLEYKRGGYRDETVWFQVEGKVKVIVPFESIAFFIVIDTMIVP